MRRRTRLRIACLPRCHKCKVQPPLIALHANPQQPAQLRGPEDSMTAATHIAIK